MDVNFSTSFVDPITQIKIPILYEDNHLIGVIKPSGVLSQADYSQQRSLPEILKSYLKKTYKKPGNAFLAILHRLDREVSGVMIFGKTSKAASRISQQIREHQFQKTYVALVEGNLDIEGRWIDKLKKRQSTSFVSTSPKAKHAELEFCIVKQKNRKTLVRIQLITGRHHQIRVQFASRGFPIIGDRKYGAKENFKSPSLALHAESLKFFHPITQEPIQIQSRAFFY